MQLDLAIYDINGKTRGYARLKLDFRQGIWVAEEDTQRAWRNAGFDQAGPLELIDDDIIWLWEREAGNAKCNTVVLSDIAIDDVDPGQSGDGRIVTGQIGRFHGGTVRWTIIESRPPMAPAVVLELMAGQAATAGKPAELPAY